MNQRQIGGRKKKLIFQAKWFGIDENNFFFFWGGGFLACLALRKYTGI